MMKGVVTGRYSLYPIFGHPVFNLERTEKEIKQNPNRWKGLSIKWIRELVEQTMDPEVALSIIKDDDFVENVMRMYGKASKHPYIDDIRIRGLREYERRLQRVATKDVLPVAPRLAMRIRHKLQDQIAFTHRFEYPNQRV